MADKVLSTITVQGLDDIPDGTYVNNPESTAGQFSASKAYAIGDHVFYNRKLYKFTSAHAAGAWNAAHVTEVTIGSEIKALDGEVGAIKNDFAELGLSVVDGALNITYNS